MIQYYVKHHGSLQCVPLSIFWLCIRECVGLDIEQAFDGFCVHISLLTAEQNMLYILYNSPRCQWMILTQPA